MKRLKWLSVNLRMTKYLFLASPAYFAINLVNTCIKSAMFIFMTLFYKYLIDFVVYEKGTLKDVILDFSIYYFIYAILQLVDNWISCKYNLNEKRKMLLYYKRFICQESVKKGLKNYSSLQYVDKLYHAVYHEAEYLSSFSRRIFGFVDSLAVFLFFLGVLVHIKPLFVLMLVLRVGNEFLIMSKNNKLGYEEYQVDLEYQKKFQHIRNVFYLKQFKKEQQIYPSADLFVRKYRQNLSSAWEKKEEFEIKIDLYRTVSSVINLLIDVGNIMLLVWLLISGTITLGDFELIIVNFGVAANNLINLILFFSYTVDDARYMNDIFEVIDTKNHLYPKIEHKSTKHCVEFTHVDFSYDGEQKILKDVSLELPLNQRIAIVGENGSGKTTFVKLLLGLYEPDKGRIEYQYPNQEIVDVSQLFSVLLQDFRTFALTISENIALKKELDEEELRRREEAVCFSGLDEKISQLPDGIDTELTGEFSDSGITFSGGEMQKLAIARAYMMDRPILILDEPSSNLDPISENELIHRINQLTKNKGVILVTHNMSYARNVDLVIVFHEGRIVEYGAPDELREKKGYFYSMAEEQMKMGI